MRPIREMIWEEFIAGLEKAGVVIETMDDPPCDGSGRHLLNHVNGHALSVHLPKLFDPKARVGMPVFFRTCRQLGVNEGMWFKEWYPEL